MEPLLVPVCQQVAFAQVPFRKGSRIMLGGHDMCILSSEQKGRLMSLPKKTFSNSSEGLGALVSRCLPTTASVSEACGVTESGRFSVSDSELSARGLELHSSVELLDLDQLNTLFVRVGFSRRQKEKLSCALEHTLSLIWLREVKSGKLIAFARATGDSVFNAIIWDVVVDPSYQGLGLGKVVMERLLAELVRKGISNIVLYAEPNVIGFYKPLGFISDPDGIRAMAYSKRRR